MGPSVIAPSVLRAMLASGATAEMIVSVIEADHEAEQAKQAVKKARDAERKRRERENARLSSGMSDGQRGHPECPTDSADTTPEIPPKKISNPPITPDTLRVSTPKRGKRLPDDYNPPENLWEKAKSLGLDVETLKFETSAFRDHFLASSGPRAVKLDWDRAWLNWMREAFRRRSKRQPKPYLKALPGGQPRFRPEPPKISQEEWKTRRGSANNP